MTRRAIPTSSLEAYGSDDSTTAAAELENHTPLGLVLGLGLCLGMTAPAAPATASRGRSQEARRRGGEAG